MVPSRFIVVYILILTRMNPNFQMTEFLDVYLEFLNIYIIVNIISSTNIRIMIGSNTKCL